MLVQADASQLEWRTLLELSRDEVGINEVLNNEDAHSLNQQAFNLPSRLIAKIYLFRTIFRGTGWSFAHDPDFMHVSTDPRFWDDIGVKFYTKYHGIDKTHKRWADCVLSGQPIVGPLGRSWSISLVEGKRGEMKLPMPTLTNYPVQGTGADIMMLARLMAYNRIKKLKILCVFVSTVHDSIVVDTPKENVQIVVDVFHQVFADLIPNIKKNFGYEWLVPMSCETKIGMNMKDMKKIQPSWA